MFYQDFELWHRVTARRRYWCRCSFVSWLWCLFLTKFIVEKADSQLLGWVKHCENLSNNCQCTGRLVFLTWSHQSWLWNFPSASPQIHHDADDRPFLWSVEFWEVELILLWLKSKNNIKKFCLNVNDLKWFNRICNVWFKILTVYL